MRLPQMMCGVRPSSVVERTTRLPPCWMASGRSFADEHFGEVGRFECGEAGDEDAAGGVGLNRAVGVVGVKGSDHLGDGAGWHGDLDDERRIVGAVRR